MRDATEKIWVDPLPGAVGQKPVTDLSTVSELETNAAQLATLAAIISSSGDAIMSARFDGAINSWNPAAERMYGYSVEEIIGQSVSILYPARMANSAAEILLKIQRGERVEHLETVRVRKDGTEFPVSLTVAPMYDSTGAVIGGSSITRDMTDLEQASRYARDILESAPDAMLITTKTGTIVTVNAQTEKLFGYHRDEMLGQSVELLMPQRSHAESHSMRAKFFANPLPQFMGYGPPIIGLRKNGEEFPIEMSRSPVETQKGVLSVASIRDVTDLQKLRKFEEMNELRNEFVALVAHDIRAPMTPISGFAQLLVEQWDELDDDTKLDYLQIVLRNADGLTEFVEDVLQVARVEAGQYNYDIRPFNIRLLAQKMFDDVAGANSERQFEFIAPEDLPLVFADEDRQTQILGNLLSNAIKFSPAEGSIIVRLSCVDSSVQVSVTDSGIGIASDDLAKLFQKSVRVFHAGDPKRPGNGLGLYICKTLVEAQGGRIWCESTPNQGSTFFYTIPLVQ